MKEFELSQSYLAFYDKFERANYFLESILQTADLPTTDRTVAHILTTGVHDGGQWAMFANIVRKYGIMPKDAYDETFQSCNTSVLNRILNQNLKVCAIKLRNMVAEKAPEKYVGDLLDNVVSVIHAPTADKPYHKTFSIRLLGNVADGKPVVHLNLTMEELKNAIISQLKDNKVVWFGSDVSNYGDREKGFWDDNSYNFELLTGLDLNIDKSSALDYGFSAMNHAMVITGVNIVDGKPDRWKIENSWGKDRGDKGYFVCSDSWFNKFVFQAAVEKEYLGDLSKFADEKPIELDPWDPMGTLAD